MCWSMSIIVGDSHIDTHQGSLLWLEPAGFIPFPQVYGGGTAAAAASASRPERLVIIDFIACVLRANATRITGTMTKRIAIRR